MQIQEYINPNRLIDLCKKIAMPIEVSRKIVDISRIYDFSDLSEPFTLLFNVDTGPEGVKAIEEHIRQHEDFMFIWLTIWLAAALCTYEQYKSKGINDVIFYDTMGCFSRFVKEHKTSYGVYGYDRSFWTYRQIAMRLFRIGTLEYEMYCRKGEDIVLGKKTVLRHGENLLSIHIPSDAQLDGENCHNSYKMAVFFFNKFYPGFQYNVFYTNTWLLSPSLQQLLPENSGILNFQKDYMLCSVDENNTGYIGSVFKSAKLDPIDYPEDTSLQRNMKKYILNGGKVGNGAGIIEKSTVLGNDV